MRNSAAWLARAAAPALLLLPAGCAGVGPQRLDMDQMGYAAAMAWVLFIIILAITAVQLWFAKRWVHYESD